LGKKKKTSPVPKKKIQAKTSFPDTYGAERARHGWHHQPLPAPVRLGDVAKANGLPPERIRELTRHSPTVIFARMQRRRR